MPLLEWKDSYSVGVEAVDHEHRELIDLINALHDEFTAGDGGGSGRRDPLAIFGDIYKGISSHFALEEKFMREHGYDQLSDHKGDHERLLDELRDIMDDYNDGGDDRQHASVELSEQLGTWFAQHFKIHDARLHSRLGTHPHG
ncbi:Hemerythrin domain protein [hydrothermal vent metagenome]|uniref:Hemerythrin domain protein n=1 Tax=hydrothermal vent metagenome TaxID=652676 RepID=A0A3B0TZG6_9ZZZZ